MTVPATGTVIAAVMKKSPIVWLTVGPTTPLLVWCTWHTTEEGSGIYLVSGGEEQQIPGLATAESCHVAARSADNHALVVEFETRVSHLSPGTPDYDEITSLLVTKRLNLRDPSAAAERWAATSLLTRLAPQAA